MTIELPPKVSYRLIKARHRIRKRLQRGAPIVVFAMAKTGTSSVAEAIRNAGFGPVFQVHDLDGAFLTEEERQYQWSGRPWRIWDAQSLLARRRSPDAPWRVVSLVRDPIAQSIAAFFQPGERRGYLNDTTAVSALVERFGDRLDRLPLGWFQSHLQPTLGIDVYAHEFDAERGYQIIKTSTVELLLLRCEGLSAAPAGLGELLGTGVRIEIPRKNVGSQKAYGPLYDDFIAQLRPSAEVIDRAYSSRLVRHFYAPDEIARFRDVWSIPRPGSPVEY
jgi:hypothetical protein